jgi:hypothetical protein
VGFESVESDELELEGDEAEKGDEEEREGCWVTQVGY